MCNQPPRPTLPPSHSSTGNEYRPKCGNALQLGIKCRMAHSTYGQTCGWQIKLCNPSLTRVIPERFRDEYRIHYIALYKCTVGKKGKGFPYSLSSVGPRPDPGVQAVSPQVTINHPPSSRLPLLSARQVTFPATKHRRPLAGTNLYCLVTEAHRCEQLAKGCYAALPGVRFEPTTC